MDSKPQVSTVKTCDVIHYVKEMQALSCRQEFIARFESRYKTRLTSCKVLGGSGNCSYQRQPSSNLAINSLTQMYYALFSLSCQLAYFGKLSIFSLIPSRSSFVSFAQTSIAASSLAVFSSAFSLARISLPSRLSSSHSSIS